METKNTAQPKALLRARLAVALFSTLCSFGIARASTEVQVPVDNESDMCSHFRKAFIADRVADMTRGQLCQYNFTQKHAGHGDGYFQRLNWQPVAGDPVPLTMKIFDANHPRSSWPVGEVINRTDVLAYAKLQNRHHALTVEMAPFSLIEVTTDARMIPVAGYVLKSIGIYCGENDDHGFKKGRKLVAFYTNNTLTHSLPIQYFDDNARVEPLEIQGRDYVVAISDSTMYSPVHYPGLTGTFTMTLGQLFVDNTGSKVHPSAVCEFTYLRRPSHHGE